MMATRPRRTPGTPPSRMPLPPCSFSRHVAPTWIAILPATSLIGLSSGSEPSSSWMRLVGHRGDLLLHQRLGQLRVHAGEVEVRVDDLAGLDALVLGLDRLLDLDDHLGALPDLVGR